MSVLSPARPATADPAPSRRIWPVVRTVGGVSILVLLLWRLGAGAVLDALRAINGQAVLAALGIGLLTTVFSAWRWCLVADGMGIRLPLWGAVADYYRALFLNAALPGGVLGDVHRAVRHGRDVGDVGRGVRAVVLERTAGQIVLVVAGVVVLLAVPSPVRSGLTAVTGSAAAVAIAVLGVGGAALVWLLRRRGGGQRWRRALGTAVADTRTGLLARGRWPWIVLASVVVLAGHVATFVLAARAAGSAAPVVTLVPLLLLALLAMSLPVNVGGWGPREGVCAWAFAAAGLGAAQGLATAVVYGTFALVASLPGVAVLALRSGVRRTQHHPPSNRSDSA